MIISFCHLRSCQNGIHQGHNFDVEEKSRRATNYVAHTVFKVPPVANTRPAAKKAVTKKPAMKAYRASVKRPVKKAPVKKAPVKKTTVNDASDKKTPVKKSRVMLDTAVDVTRLLAQTYAAVFLLLSADITPPAAVCRVAITGSSSDYTKRDDETTTIQSESKSYNGNEDVDDDDKDVFVQGGVMKPPKQLAMVISQLAVASLSPVLAQALSQELTDMGVSDILAKHLSLDSTWMGEILESLGTSDSQRKWLPNGDIAYYVECCGVVFDREVDLEALAKEDTYHGVSAFWDDALDDGVDPFDDILKRPNIMEAERMTILLKMKEEQLKDVETKDLDVHFVTKNTLITSRDSL
jgi:hypothetical protein